MGQAGLEFLALMIAFGINAVIPGADFAMVLRQSIAHGRKTAILTSAGIAVSVLVHGTYTIFGIGFIVSQSLLLFNVLKFAGAAYLVWLAWSAFRAAPPSPPEAEALAATGTMGAGRAFLLGFLTNLLNPKAVLFFLALFTTIVSADTAVWLKTAYLGAMSIELFIWFVLVSLFFTLPAVRVGFFRAGRWFNRVTGITFLLMALRVAVARQN